MAASVGALVGEDVKEVVGGRRGAGRREPARSRLETAAVADSAAIASTFGDAASRGLHGVGSSQPMALENGSGRNLPWLDY